MDPEVRWDLSHLGIHSLRLQNRGALHHVNERNSGMGRSRLNRIGLLRVAQGYAETIDDPVSHTEILAEIVTRYARWDHLHAALHTAEAGPNPHQLFARLAAELFATGETSRGGECLDRALNLAENEWIRDSLRAFLVTSLRSPQHFDLSLQLLRDIEDKALKSQSALSLASQLLAQKAEDLVRIILYRNELGMRLDDAGTLIDGMSTIDAATLIEGLCRLYAGLDDTEGGRAFLRSVSTLTCDDLSAPKAISIAVGYVVLDNVDEAVTIAAQQNSEIRDSVLAAVLRSLLEIDSIERACQILQLIDETEVKADLLGELVAWHVAHGCHDDAIRTLQLIPPGDSRAIALCSVADYFISKGLQETGVMYLAEARLALVGAAEHRTSSLAQGLAECFVVAGMLPEARDVIETIQELVERENIAHAVLSRILRQGQVTTAMDWARLNGFVSLTTAVHDAIVSRSIQEGSYTAAVSELRQLNDPYLKASRLLDLADSLANGKSLNGHQLKISGEE